MQITLTQQADPGTRFADSALAHLVGTEVPVNFGSARKQGTVIGARAVDDGLAMELTVQVPDDPDTARGEHVFSPRLDRFSIGTR